MSKILIILTLVSGVTFAQDLRQDLRIELSVRIQNMGDELQHVQDQYGIEEAHKELRQKVILALNIIEGSLTVMPDEQIENFIHDRSLSSKEKINFIFKKIREDELEKFLSEMQLAANEKGYEKAFQDLSSSLRSRAYYPGVQPNPNWRAIILLGIVLVVEVTVPTPASAYIAVPLLVLTAWLEVRDFYARQAYEEQADFFLTDPPVLIEQE